MEVDGGSLSAEQGVRDISDIVRVGVTNGIDTGNVGDQSLGAVRSKTATVQLNTKVLANVGKLGLLEAGQESIAQHGGSSGELDAEQVVLGEGGQTWVSVGIGAVAQALNGSNSSVLNLDVVNLEVLLPVGVLLLGRLAVFGGIGAIDESNNVLVKGQYLLDGARS